MKITVKLADREISIEIDFPENYTGYTINDKIKIQSEHSKRIIEIIQATVESVVKLNQ